MFIGTLFAYGYERIPVLLLSGNLTTLPEVLRYHLKVKGNPATDTKIRNLVVGHQLFELTLRAFEPCGHFLFVQWGSWFRSERSG